MAFELSDEQAMLRDALDRYLRDADALGLPARDPGAQRRIWQGLVDDIGVIGAAFAEGAGGFGGTPMDVFAVMEPFGRHQARTPYVAVVMLAALLRDLPDAALAAKAAEGRLIPAFAHGEGGRFDLTRAATVAEPAGEGWRLTGRKAVVLSGPLATHFVVTAQVAGAGMTLFLVDAGAGGLARQDYMAVDGQSACDLTLAATPARMLGAPGQGAAALAPAVDAGLAALGAESVGIMAGLIEHTAAYMRQRQQFGQPLAAFQALQHRVADMVIAREQALSMVHMAQDALERGNGAETRAACAAMKIVVDRSLRFVSQNAVQLHGGMGITDELAIGGWFRRAMVIAASFGSEDDHFRTYEAQAASMQD